MSSFGLFNNSLSYRTSSCTQKEPKCGSENLNAGTLQRWHTPEAFTAILSTVSNHPCGDFNDGNAYIVGANLSRGTAVYNSHHVAMISL